MQTGAESRTAPKRSRRRWLWTALLASVVLAIVVWSRSAITVSLVDGTTIRIAAITTGRDHRWRWPLTRRRIQNQIEFRDWSWPVETTRLPTSRTVLWFDEDPPLGNQTLILRDRHGWRWPVWGRSSLRLGSYKDAEVIERGPGAVEIFDRDNRLLGATTVSIPGPVPASPSGVESAEFPIERTEGPLSVVVHSLPVQVIDAVPSQAKGRLHLEARWKGRPIAPAFGPLHITDSLGRTSRCQVLDDGRFRAHISPHGVAWNMTLDIFRGRSEPLDPDETVSFQPRETTGRDEIWHGSVQGIAWHVTLTRKNGMPAIVVDVASINGLEIRIEPFDADGNLLPARRIPGGPSMPTTRWIGCPTFDPAKGHTLRVGFNFSRTVKFSLRPEIESDVPHR